jgi:hypothetical protein
MNRLGIRDGFFLAVIGHRSSVIRHRSSVIRQRSSVIGHRSSVIESLPTVNQFRRSVIPVISVVNLYDI